MKSIKERKNTIEVFTMKFVCFSLNIVVYFLKIQEGLKFKEILFSRGTTSFFKLKLIFKLTIVFNCACFMHFHSYLETHF